MKKKRTLKYGIALLVMAAALGSPAALAASVQCPQINGRWIARYGSLRDWTFDVFAGGQSCGRFQANMPDHPVTGYAFDFEGTIRAGTIVGEFYRRQLSPSCVDTFDFTLSPIGTNAYKLEYWVTNPGCGGALQVGSYGAVSVFR